MTRRRKILERTANGAMLTVGAVLAWSILNPDPQVEPQPETPPEAQEEAQEETQEQPQAEAAEESPAQALAIALPPPPPPAPTQAVEAPAAETQAVETPAVEAPAAETPTPVPTPPPVQTVTALRPTPPAPPPAVVEQVLTPTPQVQETPAPTVIAALQATPVEAPPPPTITPPTITPLRPAPVVEEAPAPVIEPLQPAEVPPEVAPAPEPPPVLERVLTPTPQPPAPETMPEPVAEPIRVLEPLQVVQPEQERESEPVRQDPPPPPPQPTESAAPPIQEVQVAANTPEGVETERHGRALLRLMEHDAGPDIRIAWPAAAGERERLYRVLSQCYGMKSVLMDAQGGVFQAEGPAGQPGAPDVARYSGFVRAAEGAIPALERTALRPIYRHHGLSERAANIVRLFPRKADALMLGGLANLLQGGLSSGSQVEALYALTANGIAVVEIRQDGTPVDGRVVIAPLQSCGGLV